MAGGKLTPRQKMINLMYLVFIAMLAMNMSKEVLSAFGLMNEKFEASNKASEEVNDLMLAGIDEKASTDIHFKEAASNGHRAQVICNEFYTYIETLKKEVVKGVEMDSRTGKLPYEAMDKGDNLDNLWFTGEGYTAKGTEVVSKINKYKADMKNLLAKEPKYASILAEVNSKFNTDDVKDKEGLSIKFLEYHFDRFPGIASLAKLSAWQNDVKKTESDIYSSILGKAALKAASMSNFKATVALEKNVYFEGESVKGVVVLGKFDASTVPTGFVGPGRIENGQAVISQTAGSVGEHPLNGTFTFVEEGKSIPIPFKGSYVVVPRPNSATVSADKMNVVYRGVDNPMTISFAGVANNSVKASAPGLSPAGKPGTYLMSPGSGTEVTINVSATLPDGKVVPDNKVFRIKNVPAPLGAIAGQYGVVKGAKSRLQVSQVSAVLPDFLFDLTFNVKQFAFKVPGQATIIVNGDRVNAQCAAALQRAAKGDQIVISDIITSVPSGKFKPLNAAPVIYEIQ
jgi:gliding motility-associated protein GldM